MFHLKQFNVVGFLTRWLLFVVHLQDQGTLDQVDGTRE
jgi:hypothetical protein